MADQLGLGLLGGYAAPPVLRKRRRRKLKPSNDWVDQQVDLFLGLTGGEETPDPWTDEEVAFLQEGLLYRCLQDAVDGRTAASTRAEAWEWIEGEDTHPFSFEACARTVGVDPDELRKEYRALAVRVGSHLFVGEARKVVTGLLSRYSGRLNVAASAFAEPELME